jgi:hypothetical protein
VTDREPDVREAGFPDTVDDADPQDRTYPEPQEPALPGDDYLGAQAVGTTATEELEGESLDEKLAREVPDDAAQTVGADVAERRGDGPDTAPVGRLVEPDEGAHTDTETDMVASAPGGTRDLSPEEQALHVEPEV